MVLRRAVTYLRGTVKRLRSSDLEVVLAFVEEAYTVEGPEPFTPELLDRLATLVPCENVSFEEANVAERALLSKVDSRSGYGCDTQYRYRIQSLSDEAWSVMDASPIGAYRRRTGDFGMVKWSDLFGRRARVRYNVQPEIHLVDMASVWLAPSLVHKISVVFNSERRDFSERDRLVIDRLRPCLGGLYRAAGVRRLLAAALTGLEDGSDQEGRGVLLRGRDGRLEFASHRARALLRAYFGESGGRRLPLELEAWIQAQARRPDRPATTPAAQFTRARAGRRLVVNAGGPGLSVLLLIEEDASVVSVTPREWDVMRCVAAGRSNAEIAGLLWITRGTVRRHLENVYDKLGVHSRTAAVVKLRSRLAGTAAIDARERELPTPQR
jgi:DNA-binding CsgD family transcriptional regulator